MGVYIGTAGWLYDDWQNVFYPQKQSASFNLLQFYSVYFNVVEVNSTYYTYLKPNIIEGWVDKTSDNNNFKFVIKLHQDFTHRHKFENKDVSSFTSNLDILKSMEKLGGILIQFPYSFQFNANNLEYLYRIIEIFEQYERFIEVRHSSWNNEGALEFLSSRKITICTIDQPEIGSSLGFTPLITSKTAYFRMHGRNKEEWLNAIKNYGKEMNYQQQNARYKYLYSPGEIAEIDSKIREIYNKVENIYVIMNNHPSGYATVNSFELMYILGNGEKISVPKTTLNNFNRLRNIAI